MRIAVISDTHDRLDMIRRAVEQMATLKVELVIHCGDYVAPFAIPPFEQLRVPFVGVFGNNDGEKRGLEQKIISIGGIVRPGPLMKTFAGRQFLITHELLTETELRQNFGKIDFYLYGHTHQMVEKDLDGIRIVNPGEACGWLSAKATFALLETETKKVEIVQIS